MLFLPKSIHEARTRLWRDVEAGTLTREQAYRKTLDIYPDDHIGILGAGRELLDAGDLAGAEQYFRQALQVQPCTGLPYAELSRLLAGKPETEALSHALAELGAIKIMAIRGDSMEEMDRVRLGMEGPVLEAFEKLSPEARLGVSSLVLRKSREQEPESVTREMRRLRLIHDLQLTRELGPETVDAIIAEGDAMVPLLVGALRGWAQNLIGENQDAVAENSLALLGEMGAAAEIPHVLEFVDYPHDDVEGASKWALGRIAERHPSESVKTISAICAHLGPAERIAVAEKVLPRVTNEQSEDLFHRLSRNLEAMPMNDRGGFFPELLAAMVDVHGMSGVQLGRTALFRQKNMLSRSAREECEEFLTIWQEEDVPARGPDPDAPTIYQICAGETVWDIGDDEDEYDEPIAAPEPVRRRALPERNDPCWCGSGRKYKKCHLDSDHETANPTPAADEFVGLRKSIGEFLGEAVPAREMKRALNEFFGDQVESGNDGQITLIDWVLHDWIAPNLRRTVMQEYLRRHSRLSERERNIIQGWTESFVGFYEVQDTSPGKGVTLLDLIFGNTIFVHDVSMSTRLVRWDGVLTRVVPGERGLELTGIGMVMARHNLDTLREWMEQDREESGVEWRAYLKGNWPRIRQQAFAITSDAVRHLRLANTDGEELLISKSVYKVSDGNAVRDALRSRPEMDEDPAGGRFVWLNEKKTILGNIKVTDDELMFEANSQQRLDRGNQLLIALAGTWLQHVRDEFTTQQELKRQAMESAGKPSAPSTIPREVQQEFMERYLADHYGKWPDEPLPALGGKTPREAVKTEKGRLQVADVLKSIENSEERKRLEGDPFYDIGPLRRALGIE